MNTLSSPSAALYRIGAVSQTTGVPVSTLRIWETRYGAFTPVKTAGKQRLFEERDVSKALLLKQLSSAGHAISSIAGLGLEQLRRLSNAAGHVPAAASTQPLSLAVVGLGMANRIESKQFAKTLPQQIKVTQVFADLPAADEAALSGEPRVLLIKVSTLQPQVYTAIRTLVAKHPLMRTVIIYNFATDAVVQAMKLSGLVVRREPISDAELAELLQQAMSIEPDRMPPAVATVAAVESRKYSEATLSRVAGMSTSVLCECPRHVAEILSQLASFEDYSQECLNTRAEDAQLHDYLRSISGSARMLFENALEKIAQLEGIDLREDASVR